MLKQFPGHFKQKEENISAIWKSGIFVFDANTLLNLYRYSNETTQVFLKLLEEHQERIWLPEQAAHEYLSNRTGVISDQIRSYEQTLRDIKKIQDSFSISRGHPFISTSAKKQLDDAIEKLNEELEKSRQQQEELIYKDTIKEKLGELFEDCVGEPLDNLDELFVEGKKRYESKIPPGYKDGGKHKEPISKVELRSNFGDWILWSQLLKYAKESSSCVILVTDDRKEDWWEISNGKTIGPRPELIAEFEKITEQAILLYTPESFLNEIEKQLKIEVSKSSIKEVEAEQAQRSELINEALSEREFSKWLSPNEAVGPAGKRALYSQKYLEFANRMRNEYLHSDRKDRLNYKETRRLNRIIRSVEEQDQLWYELDLLQTKKNSLMEIISEIDSVLSDVEADKDSLHYKKMSERRLDALQDLSKINRKIDELRSFLD